jgi:hypothetical protein
LPHAAADRLRQLVFGITAAHGNECAQRSRERLLGGGRALGLAGDGRRERIVENSGLIQELMGRAAHRDPLGSQAGFSLAHAPNLPLFSLPLLAGAFAGSTLARVPTHCTPCDRRMEA